MKGALKSLCVSLCLVSALLPSRACAESDPATEVRKSIVRLTLPTPEGGIRCAGVVLDQEWILTTGACTGVNVSDQAVDPKNPADANRTYVASVPTLNESKLTIEFWTGASWTLPRPVSQIGMTFRDSAGDNSDVNGGRGVFYLEGIFQYSGFSDSIDLAWNQTTTNHSIPDDPLRHPRNVFNEWMAFTQNRHVYLREWVPVDQRFTKDRFSLRIGSINRDSTPRSELDRRLRSLHTRYKYAFLRHQGGLPAGVVPMNIGTTSVAGGQLVNSLDSTEDLRSKYGSVVVAGFGPDAGVPSIRTMTITGKETIGYTDMASRSHSTDYWALDGGFSNRDNGGPVLVLQDGAYRMVGIVSNPDYWVGAGPSLRFAALDQTLRKVRTYRLFAPLSTYGSIEELNSVHAVARSNLPGLRTGLPLFTYSADLDGDGVKEKIFHYADNSFRGASCLNADCSVLSPLTFLVQHGDNALSGKAQFADVDGNGTDDMIYQGNDSSFWLSLSLPRNGAPVPQLAFLPPTKAMQHGGGFVEGQTFYPDVNGDGKADLVLQGNDNRFWASISVGTAFGPPYVIASHGGSFTKGQSQFKDENLDGCADLIFLGNVNDYWISLSADNCKTASQPVMKPPYLR